MSLSTEHKEAMATGRRQSRAVATYLQKLHEVKPRRGRRRTPDSIRKRLGEIEAAIPEASLLQTLSLTSEKANLETELRALEGNDGPSLSDAEADFVKVARDYGERKGITYAAWKEAGVPTEVLTRAKITR